MDTTSLFLQTLGLALLAPAFTGVVRKTKAYLQNRQGAPIWQPYLELQRLFRKQPLRSTSASPLFGAWPPLYAACALGAAAMLPILPGTGNDLLFLGGLWALGRFCLAIAGLEVSSAFGGMGSSREMYVAALVEPALLLSFFQFALSAGATSLASLLEAAQLRAFGLPEIFAATAFFTVLLAESGRIPVDNPDTHLELTMIHEAMVLEYAGQDLAPIHWASMIRELTLAFLFASLFLPVLPAPFDGFFGLFLKTLLTAPLIGLAEMVTVKMRLFRVPQYLALSAVFSLLSLSSRL